MSRESATISIAAEHRMGKLRKKLLGTQCPECGALAFGDSRPPCEHFQRTKQVTINIPAAELVTDAKK
jgi:hypothetical protein